MAYLPTPDITGTMGTDNQAELITPPFALVLQQFVGGFILPAPTADMLADLNAAGIEAVPIIG